MPCILRVNPSLRLRQPQLSGAAENGFAHQRVSCVEDLNRTALHIAVEMDPVGLETDSNVMGSGETTRLQKQVADPLPSLNRLMGRLEVIPSRALGQVRIWRNALREAARIGCVAGESD